MARAKAGTVGIDKQLTLSELWDSYCKSRSGQLTSTTLELKYIKYYGGLLDKCPHKYPSEALKVKHWLLLNRSEDTTKRFLIQLNALMRWAVSRGLASENTFKDLDKDLRLNNNSQIDPFTVNELSAILDVFHGHYFESFIRFLALTGCRTSEAVALQWSQIELGYTHLTFNASYSLDLRQRKPTKNSDHRRIPCNASLAALLANQPRIDHYVFHSTVGTVVNIRTLCAHVWQPRIQKLIDAGQVGRYRPVNNLRHTAITRMLESGLTIPEVAYIVGNTPRMIMQYYSGVSCNLKIPETL
ncbi:tyrosine-type recombinase/integrase [Nostoc sp. LPT]|uniref:tyrosine-type recombinase/integrase n=1 Tax=Nostoc sp. LPT TaxID=2815387 RepID=UPI001DA7ACE1|nr:tyrosine-type recombinase/integrase [Nostoc sp. LPT]MBN4000699.1 tyrosine-type recombinase/integrase [Nostoc sp. LPT]